MNQHAKSVRTFLIANVSGQVWSLLINVAAIPAYIHFLGMESVGLLGVFANMLAAIRIFDLGLTLTVTREIARRPAGQRTGETRDLFHTFEMIFGGVAVLIALAIPIAAPLIARHWLHPQALTPQTVTHALMLMGLLCGISWVSLFYQAVMYALERHVAVTLLRVGEVTFTVGGALLLIIFVRRSIVLLFAWQVFVVIVFALAAFILVRRSLPPSAHKPAFHVRLFRGVWGITAGMAGINLTLLVLTQADRIVLSNRHILSLAQFGDYTLGFYAASTAVMAIVTPTYNVMFPRFSALVAAGEEKALTDLYRLCVQLLGALTISFTTAMFLFARPLLLVWTRDAAVAQSVARLLQLLALAFTINAVMYPAYALQLSHACTTLVIRLYSFLIVIFLPLLVVLSWKFGAIGGAAAVLIMNGVYLAVGLPLTHPRLLPVKPAAILVGDILPPVAACAVLAGLMKVAGLPRAGAGPALVQIAVGGMLLLGGAVLACGRLRQPIIAFVRQGGFSSPRLPS